MKLRDQGRIVVGIFLIIFGINSISNIHEHAQGFYWGRLMHTIFGDYFANALEGVMLISVGVYFVYKSLDACFCIKRERR